MPADWRARAQEPDDALRCVHSGMTLFVHGAAATPTPLLEALVRRTDLADVTLFHMHTEGPAPLATPEHQHRTNDTSIIRRNDRVVAINSALEVDLSGQVCADSVGVRIYSGIGGQMDFIRGAALSEGGQPISALPSTAAGGAVSRIVPALTRGAGVVLSGAQR